MTSPPSITCPKCGRTSYSLKDYEEGYCGNCHDWTSPPVKRRPGAVLHLAEGDTPMLDGYAYSATGVGVRQDAIEAVLRAWASIAPGGDPATTLRSVNDGCINEVGSLARITAQGLLRHLQASGDLGPDTTESSDK